MKRLAETFSQERMSHGKEEALAFPEPTSKSNESFVK
jgi:hypothetical protein